MDRALIRKHFEEMPQMQPIDAVKLAYQHAFGCGHLLPQSEECRLWLLREMEEADESAAAEVCTSIGGGLCRLNLRAPAVRALGAECIAAMMQATERHVISRSNPENEKRFYSALMDVESVIDEGAAAFDREAWEACCLWHSQQGRPAVSHSEAFRTAYEPHYRVVMEDYALLFPVMEEIRKGRSLVVIDGPCGSGKTTLSRLLAALYDTQPIPMDDFFLPPDLRTPERLAIPGGNVHHERFSAEILDKIKVGEPLAYQRFDCQTGTFVPKQHRAAPVMVIEGSYSHHPAFAQAYKRLRALRVFVEVEGQEQLSRIRRRNPEMFQAFQSRWIPLEKTYFQAYDSKDQADIVLVSQPWNEGL